MVTNAVMTDSLRLCYKVNIIADNALGTVTSIAGHLQKYYWHMPAIYSGSFTTSNNQLNKLSRVNLSKTLIKHGHECWIIGGNNWRIVQIAIKASNLLRTYAFITICAISQLFCSLIQHLWVCFIELLL